jgi:phytoene desaturase
VVAIVSELKDGYYLPEKGMGQIPEVLAGVLRSYGGEIELNARVKRIWVRGKRGLEFVNGEFFEADEIISSASGMLTFGKLMAQEDTPASMRRKAENVKLSMKGFTVQIGTRQKAAANNFLTYVIPPLRETNDHYMSNGRSQYGIFGAPTVALPDLAPAGTSVLEIGYTIPSNAPLSKWTDEETEHVANEALEMTRRYVDFDIAVKRVRSPRQFQEQLNLHEGAIYGISPLTGIFGFFPQKPPVPGLYLTGQTTFPGFGATPAAVSGILLAERYF